MLDVLDGDGAVLHLDRLLNRDDVHADSRASGRHHRRGLCKSALGGLLEKLRHRRMLVDLGLAHVEELGRAGHKHGQHPLLRAGGVLPVVLEQTDVAHLIEQLLERLGLHTGDLDRVGKRVGSAHLHLEQNVGHLVGRYLGERPILKRLELFAAKQAVGAVLAQRHDFGTRVLGDRRDELGADIRLGERDARAVDDHVCSFPGVRRCLNLGTVPKLRFARPASRRQRARAASPPRHRCPRLSWR